MNAEERLAVLEANQERLQKDTQELFILIRNLDKFMRDHMNRGEREMEEIRSSITKYKGFVGGIIFTVSSVATAIGLFLGFFHK